MGEGDDSPKAKSQVGAGISKDFTGRQTSKTRKTMFDKTSRYFEIETVTREVLDDRGRTREIRYVRRRFVPRQGSSVIVHEHTVIDGQRPDTITGTYFGDPTQFWQICDANNVMHPEELTDDVGKSIRIPMPGL